MIGMLNHPETSSKIGQQSGSASHTPSVIKSAWSMHGNQYRSPTPKAALLAPGQSRTASNCKAAFRKVASSARLKLRWLSLWKATCTPAIPSAMQRSKPLRAFWEAISICCSNSNSPATVTIDLTVIADQHTIPSHTLNREVSP
jgi:hypothetical protein